MHLTQDEWGENPSCLSWSLSQSITLSNYSWQALTNFATNELVVQLRFWIQEQRGTCRQGWSASRRFRRRIVPFKIIHFYTSWRLQISRPICMRERVRESGEIKKGKEKERISVEGMLHLYKSFKISLKVLPCPLARSKTVFLWAIWVNELILLMLQSYQKVSRRFYRLSFDKSHLWFYLFLYLSKACI